MNSVTEDKKVGLALRTLRRKRQVSKVDTRKRRSNKGKHQDIKTKKALTLTRTTRVRTAAHSQQPAIRAGTCSEFTGTLRVCRRSEMYDACATIFKFKYHFDKFKCGL